MEENNYTYTASVLHSAATQQPKPTPETGASVLLRAHRLNINQHSSISLRTSGIFCI